MRFLIVSWITLTASMVLAESPPFYKPSSRSPEAIDITLNSYGASSIAPEALGVDEVAADLVLPLSGGGNFTLSDASRDRPVVIIFYRGHW